MTGSTAARGLRRMKEGRDFPKKPRALRAGSRVAVFAAASPAEEARTQAGIAEIKRLGYSVRLPISQQSAGYFAGTAESRREDLKELIAGEDVEGLIALRGGYGSNYLLEEGLARQADSPKCVVGYSDLTSLQVYLWQKLRWVTIYGPMVAAGFDAGAGMPGGYDEESFRSSVCGSEGEWTIRLRGEWVVPGEAEGRILGGCMTLVETSIGTPWELDTSDAILLLEDRGMKPWQVDRALMHLKQAGKFEGVRGLLLGEFPECEPPVPGSPSVREVCERILGALGVPIVFGAPVGHTQRPMLTVPLGVRGRLQAQGEGVLEILEPAVER
jgi:muramoyltetrapeptide carboxypeptidase